MENTTLNKAKKPSFGLHKLLALSVLVILYVFFSIFGNNFLSWDTLINILNASYYIGFMAIGVTFVIITGGIDLSLGTTLMTSALIGGAAYNMLGWSIAASLVLTILTATAFGILNGVMVAYLKLPPFIATLGSQMVGMGFGAIVTKVMTMRYPTVGTEDAWFKYVFYMTDPNSPIGRFPVGALWLLAAFLVASVLLNQTRFGRYTYAIGSNREAARLSGIKTRRWLALIYTLCGFFSGLAGIFFAAAYTTIIPGTGNGLELLAIAGVVIGGTSMSGGVGSLTGTMIGVFVMSVLKQGLMSMGLQGHWQTFFTGIVVIGAVLLDNYRIAAANRVKKPT
ncbi:MAG: Ribose transport system permease protein RbsC [Firmicutes bacterium ADurb.Bin182]|nr:MAG: Ribose transport system permease protein RbsC [Firmicutes bacterium ADurb.Bin182]